jgi:hypothetical protein
VETRKLAAIVVSLCNALVDCLNEGIEMIEKELAKGDDDTPVKEKAKSEKPKRPGRAGKVEKEEEEEEEEEETSDEPSEDDCVDAARAALKVLDRNAVAKLIKKHGKAEKASEVEAEYRQKVIDELEKAVDAA